MQSRPGGGTNDQRGGAVVWLCWAADEGQVRLIAEAEQVWIRETWKSTDVKTANIAEVSLTDVASWQHIWLIPFIYLKLIEFSFLLHYIVVLIVHVSNVGLINISFSILKRLSFHRLGFNIYILY